MNRNIGPFLRRAIEALTAAEPDRALRAFAEVRLSMSADDERVPVWSKIDVPRAKRGETWSGYRERIAEPLERAAERLAQTLGTETRVAYAAGVVLTRLKPNQAEAAAALDHVKYLEVDAQLTLTAMDDALVDLDLQGFHSERGPLSGRGVRVAVLDSGIDRQHPFLSVSESISTCGESDDIPGQHGTHCAGILASRHPLYAGVASDVDLLNVKVLNRFGSGTHAMVALGIDTALDLQPDILSISIGFNHLPHWWTGGHDWQCADGRCALCSAIDNATSTGVLCVVSAGNEHDRAQGLRNVGLGNNLDTELTCPGQARFALTVGAITKRTFLPASFSSRGPTAYSKDKPDIAAPGVNITSTVPVPRASNGTPVAGTPASDLFGRDDGTSMATPMVAGAAALMLEALRAAGRSTNPEKLRKAVLAEMMEPTGLLPNIVGPGRLDLT